MRGRAQGARGIVQGQARNHYVGEASPQGGPASARSTCVKSSYIRADKNRAGNVGIDEDGIHWRVGKISADVGPTNASVGGHEHVAEAVVETGISVIRGGGVGGVHGNGRDGAGEL